MSSLAVADGWWEGVCGGRQECLGEWGRLRVLMGSPGEKAESD